MKEECHRLVHGRRSSEGDGDVGMISMSRSIVLTSKERPCRDRASRGTSRFKLYLDESTRYSKAFLEILLKAYLLIHAKCLDHSREHNTASLETTP